MRRAASLAGEAGALRKAITDRRDALRGCPLSPQNPLYAPGICTSSACMEGICETELCTCRACMAAWLADEAGASRREGTPSAGIVATHSFDHLTTGQMVQLLFGVYDEQQGAPESQFINVFRSTRTCGARRAWRTRRGRCARPSRRGGTPSAGDLRFFVIPRGCPSPNMFTASPSRQARGLGGGSPPSPQLVLRPSS